MSDLFRFQQIERAGHIEFCFDIQRGAETGTSIHLGQSAHMKQGRDDEDPVRCVIAEVLTRRFDARDVIAIRLLYRFRTSRRAGREHE